MDSTTDPRRQERLRMMSALERDGTGKVKWPDDILDYEVWQTDDEIVDFFDSEGRIRPAPASIDRNGGGDFWRCHICNDAGNRDPSGRELWVGARVEAAAPGTRSFNEATVMRIRVPQPDVFGEMDPNADMTFDVRFDDGKRVNCDKQRVRIAAKCRTCGRVKGKVPMWETDKNFINAIKCGNLPVVEQLSEAGEDLEQESPVGNTPLLLAANGGKVGVVNYLLSLQVSTSHRNQEEATALHLAARKGHAGCVAALLHADPSQAVAMEGLGRTPLALAAAGGHAACVRLLCVEAAHVLVETTASSHTRTNGGEAAAAAAAAVGHAAAAAVTTTVEVVNAPDHQGLTPFFKAASAGHVECMKLLLDFGARRESLAQSMAVMRDRRPSSVVERHFYESTPDGRDAQMSRALGVRYRMI